MSDAAPACVSAGLGVFEQLAANSATVSRPRMLCVRDMIDPLLARRGLWLVPGAK